MTPAQKILQKTLVTSGLDSSQLNQVQAGLMDRSFVSSRVESARFLASSRDQIAELAAGGRSASEIRRDLRKLLDAEGYQADAGDEGTIKDLRSQARLNVLIETNARQARGYVQQLEGNTPGALAAFPGQELIRTRNSLKKRDWTGIWQGKGGSLKGGRMVALKSDPVWVKISRFNVPWPPFDFGSGMGVQDLSRDECISLGLIRAEDPPPQPVEVPGFNSNFEAEVPFTGTNTPEWLWLKDSFGDQITYQGGKIKWQGELMRYGDVEVNLGKAQPSLVYTAPDAIQALLDGTSLTLPEDWAKRLKKPKDKGIAIAPADYDLISSVWRSPDRVTPGDDLMTAVLELDTFDGSTLKLVVDLSSGAIPTSLYKEPAK